MDRFYPQCHATSLGIFPHTSPDKFIEKLFKYFPEIPCWPQLPNAGLLEDSYIQFSEGLPKFILDTSQKRGYFDTSRAMHESLKAFQKCYAMNDINYFAISLEFSAGFHRFLDALADRDMRDVKCLKGQVIGPLSFGLQITDEKKHPVLNNQEVFDIVIRCLTMKARWQIRQLKKIHPEVIIFINEPLLAASGAHLSSEKIVTVLNEIIDGIHDEGGMAGIVSNNSYDFSKIMETRTDFLYYNTDWEIKILTASADRVKTYFENGGSILWGLVSSTDESAETIIDKYENDVESLSQIGLDRQVVLNQTLITHTGEVESVSEKSSEQILKMVNSVSKSLHKKYFKSQAK